MGEARPRTANDVLQSVDGQCHYAMRQQTIPAKPHERVALEIASDQHYEQTDRNERPAVTKLLTDITEQLKD